MVDMEENKKKETKVRRKFDREFKNAAVRLVELSNRSVKQVAKELDISEAALSNWMDFLTKWDTSLCLAMRLES